MDRKEYPTLSIVVIGLNEEARLESCLESEVNAEWPQEKKEVIYVDSGSRDKSLEIAKSFKDVRVLELKDPRPNASKGRNLGWRSSKGKLVQFLDGDMELYPSWPGKAWEFLEKNPGVAQVHGEVREKDRENLFHRLFELEWEPYSGEVRISGGAGLYRREVLERLGGFSPHFPVGEEPDLCWRIRNELGMKVWKLSEPMAIHDLDMHSVSEWWKRAEKSGIAYAKVGFKYWKTREPLWKKELMTIMFMGSLLPAAVILSLAVWSIWPIAALLAGFCLLVMRKTFQLRKRAGSLFISFLYSLNVYFAKVPLFVGVLKEVIGRLFRPKADGAGMAGALSGNAKR